MTLDCYLVWEEGQTPVYSAEAFGQAWFAGKREALEAPGLKGGCSGVMYSGNDACVLQQCSFALTVQGVYDRHHSATAQKR